MNQHLNNYPKSIATSYVLLFFFGWLGAHRYYIKNVGLGILYTLTLGVFGVGILIDVFILADRTSKQNEAIRLEELGRQVDTTYSETT